MQMIMYNCLLFLTSSIAYVMLIKMYCTGSLLNSLSPQNIYPLGHCKTQYMLKCWTSCHNLSCIFYTFLLDFFGKCLLNWLIALRWILTFTYEGECVKNSTSDQPVLWNSSGVHLINLQLTSIEHSTVSPLLTMEEQQGDEQGQWPGGRSWVRLHGGMERRQNRGRGRRGQGDQGPHTAVVSCLHV